MAATDPTADDDWWASFYDDTTADMFLVRSDPADVEATTAFLADRLGLRPGGLVFDQCCGIGSASLPLTRRGVRVVGVDLCESYVRRANQCAASVDRREMARYHRADAFDFVPDDPCDAAFNWYSSFGYAADDRRNVVMLRRTFDALRPGGRFALDYLNVAGVLAGFKPAIVRRQGTPAGEVLLLRESTLDLPRGVMEQRWTYVLPDGRRSVRNSRVRLYLPHALADLLREAGFVDVEFFGGVRGEPLTTDAARCICVASRPG